MEKHFKITTYLPKLISGTVRMQERQMDVMFLGTYTLLVGEIILLISLFIVVKKQPSGSNRE